MDELEISGKRYISTRRAGKENKYHADYIGQLIRAKKVAGQKVGRSWYVDADSLAEYLGQETQKGTSVRPLTPRVRVVAEAEPASEVEETFESEEEVVVEIKNLEAKKEDTLFYRTTREAREAREARGGLRYIADEGPLLPKMQRQVSPNVVAIRHVEAAPIPTKIFERAPEHQYTERQTYQTLPDASFAPTTPRGLHSAALSKKAKGPSIVVRAVAVLAVGLVVFAVAALASTHLLFTVTVDGGQSANAGYGLK